MLIFLYLFQNPSILNLALKNYALQCIVPFVVSGYFFLNIGILSIACSTY